MLTVDRPQPVQPVCIASLEGSVDEVTTGHERLLVRQRHSTAGTESREDGGQRGHAGRRDDDEVDALERRELHEPVRRRCTVMRPGGRIGPCRQLRLPHRATMPGGEGDHPEPVAQPVDDLERLPADRARRTEDRDPPHARNPATSMA